MNNLKPPLKPIPSPIRLIREHDLGPYCKECGSSLKWKLWPLFKLESKGCIQSKCKNYYEYEINKK